MAWDAALFQAGKIAAGSHWVSQFFGTSTSQYFLSENSLSEVYDYDIQKTIAHRYNLCQTLTEILNVLHLTPQHHFSIRLPQCITYYADGTHSSASLIL